jgi:hypothetical protein
MGPKMGCERTFEVCISSAEFDTGSSLTWMVAKAMFKFSSTLSRKSSNSSWQNQRILFISIVGNLSVLTRSIAGFRHSRG